MIWPFAFLTFLRRDMKYLYTSGNIARGQCPVVIARRRVVRDRPIEPVSEPRARVSTESSNVPELRSRLDGIERPELHAEHFRLGLRLGRHVSADNLVLVVLRREKTHHIIIVVSRASLTTAIIFTPHSPRGRARSRARPRTYPTNFIPPFATITVTARPRPRARARPPARPTRSSRNPKPVRRPIHVDASPPGVDADTARDTTRARASYRHRSSSVARTLNFAMMLCDARRVEAEVAAESPSERSSVRPEAEAPKP